MVSKTIILSLLAGLASAQSIDWISQLKNTPVEDVRKYGAVASVGVDSTAAIQAAIDAIASAQGGAVYIPRGDYGIGTINVNQPGLHLIGEGGSGSVRLYARFQSTPGPGIKITANGVTIAHIAVNGQDGTSDPPPVVPTAGFSVDGTGVPGGITKTNFIDVGSEGHFALGAMHLKNAVNNNWYACGFQATSGAVLYLNSDTSAELDNENTFFGTEFHQMSLASTWPVVHVTGTGGHNTLRMYAPLFSANTDAPPIFKLDANTSDYLFSGMKVYTDTGGITPLAAFELAASTTHQNLILDAVVMEPAIPLFSGAGAAPGLQVRAYRGGTTPLAELLVKNKAAGIADTIDCRAAGNGGGDGCKIVLTQDDGAVSATFFTTGGGSLRLKSVNSLSLHTASVGVDANNERIRLDADGTINLLGLTKWGSSAEPTCNVANRGSVVMLQGGGGVADTFRICGKNAAGAFAYQPLATFP